MIHSHRSEILRVFSIRIHTVSAVRGLARALLPWPARRAKAFLSSLDGLLRVF